MREKTLFLVTIITFALAACAPMVVPDEQKRPEDVRTGMSKQQVDRLMGKPKQSCWTYGQGEWNDDKVCFNDDIAYSVSKKTAKPGTNDFYLTVVDIAPASKTASLCCFIMKDGDPPPQAASPSATEVAQWMTPSLVTKSKGRPSMMEEDYLKGEDKYRAFFSNDVLTKFGMVRSSYTHGGHKVGECIEIDHKCP
ncbi:hypothetical protein [Reyranella sp.]|uniref:hypothetical protein n=1 Tax=Reyranella sp. TaxID=1929291 RepID=UPI003D09CA7F